jgi:hypothetical protein
MIIKCLEKNKVICFFTCSNQSDLTLLPSLLSDCYPSPFFYFPFTCVVAFEGPGNPIFFWRLRLCVLLIVQWNEDKAALFLEQEQEKQDALAAKASKDDD